MQNYGKSVRLRPADTGKLPRQRHRILTFRRIIVTLSTEKRGARTMADAAAIHHKTTKRTDETILRPAQPHYDGGHTERRPHGDGHDERVRTSDAVRHGRGVSAAHYEEAAPQVDNTRTAVVSQRRHQREVSSGQRREDMERMGRRERRTWSRIRTSVALVARLQRRNDRPDCGRSQSTEDQSRLTPDDCLCMECGRGRTHGPATVPHTVPVMWPTAA